MLCDTKAERSCLVLFYGADAKHVVVNCNAAIFVLFVRLGHR